MFLLTDLSLNKTSLLFQSTITNKLFLTSVKNPEDSTLVQWACMMMIDLAIGSFDIFGISTFNLDGVIVRNDEYIDK